MNSKQKKAQIRQQIRKLRQSISPEQSLKAGNTLVNQITQHPIYTTSQNIACFLSFDGEISTQPLIERLWQDKKSCFLPKLKPNKPNRLWFMPYQFQQQLIPNRLGIPEVDLPVNHAMRISQLDLILMPLVAFDPLGNRLGMGGGFYDATLAYLNEDNALKLPYLHGLAFDEQKQAAIPTDAWDIKLDGVFTEKQHYSFR